MRKDPKFPILNKSYLLMRSFVIFYFICLKIRLRSPMFLQCYKLTTFRLKSLFYFIDTEAFNSVTRLSVGGVEKESPSEGG